MGSPARDGSSAWKAASATSRAAWMPHAQPTPGGWWANVAPGQRAASGSPTDQGVGLTTLRRRASGPDRSTRQVRSR
jgi:hypothetical protein